jgi:hypothetical protein
MLAIWRPLKYQALYRAIGIVSGALTQFAKMHVEPASDAAPIKVRVSPGRGRVRRMEESGSPGSPAIRSRSFRHAREIPGVRLQEAGRL